MGLLGRALERAQKAEADKSKAADEAKAKAAEAEAARKKAESEGDTKAAAEAKAERDEFRSLAKDLITSTRDLSAKIADLMKAEREGK